jgi:endonuclease/exonuclease/phosphatase family metal-dependent hydrolase
MREELRNTNADIGFFQEIQGEHVTHAARLRDWPDTPQFEFLADQVWSHYAYGKNAIYAAGHHGNAILSKYPFINWENLNVSSLRRASRSILHGVVKIPDPDRRLHVICVHLDIRNYERKRQLGILNDRIREHVPQNESLILAGDFNDWRGQADVNLPADLQLQEVFRSTAGDYAKTYPAWWPVFAVDRIYYRGVTLVSGACLDQRHWKDLSDHVPLYAEFEIAT